VSVPCWPAVNSYACKHYLLCSHVVLQSEEFSIARRSTPCRTPRKCNMDDRFTNMKSSALGTTEMMTCSRKESYLRSAADTRGAYCCWYG
jgi:hypothetical protein